MNVAKQPWPVCSISLQPGTNDVFVLACEVVNILRLFDIRTSLKGNKLLISIAAMISFFLLPIISVPVMETITDDGKFWSASFSPMDKNFIAATCEQGGQCHQVV